MTNRSFKFISLSVKISLDVSILDDMMYDLIL